jgi:hypothetical protein
MHAEQFAKDAANRALVVIARHLPPRIQLGRPIQALPDPENDAVRVQTSTGWWWVYANEAEVDRVTQFAPDWYELVTFRDGVEVGQRKIQRITDEDLDDIS